MTTSGGDLRGPKRIRKMTQGSPQKSDRPFTRPCHPLPPSIATRLTKDGTRVWSPFTFRLRYCYRARNLRDAGIPAQGRLCTCMSCQKGKDSAQSSPRG